MCTDRLRDIDFPSEFLECADVKCNNINHRNDIDKLYHKIVNILRDVASVCYNKDEHKLYRRKKRHIIGWNKHVKEAHGEARLCFLNWVSSGKPTVGSVYDKMCESRKIFKQKLKWCQDNQTQIKMDILATQHNNKNFKNFWKVTNKMCPKPSVPVSIGGISDPIEISNQFKERFSVKSLVNAVSAASVADVPCGEYVEHVTSKHIKHVIAGMKRGKSPGHDSLSVEHLQHAGVHLPRVLAMLFTVCISHTYLPDDMMRTVVVPIVKNKTGDSANFDNYRPISLATIIAKVLDGVLNTYLEKHLNLHDAQFGFKSGLSTETAVLTLKHTVQYYTKRSTPVYACFLDLSKAFDLVSYDKLWHKLSNDTSIPRELIALFKYWYGNQNNFVKWAGSHSDEYRLSCGVRQGGITSPKLFNLYTDRLIRELCNSQIGCSIDGVFINNISYADDMVLLSPSIAALRKLIAICESYAEAHGLKYNAAKSELMIFKANRKTYDSVPPVTLNKCQLKLVSQFKYLGHWVADTLCDDADIERERRALSVRGNMLVRRFARCHSDVKITLFRAYCQTFYTCSLWVKYTQRTWNALRIQYNNVFRALLRLPRFCSASQMFAVAGVDGFAAIMRKRTASMIRRLRSSSNTYLHIFAERMECDSLFMQRWTDMHVK